MSGIHQVGMLEDVIRAFERELRANVAQKESNDENNDRLKRQIKDLKAALTISQHERNKMEVCLGSVVNAVYYAGDCEESFILTVSLGAKFVG